MNKYIKTQDVLGCPVEIDMDEMETSQIVTAMGGVLIKKIIDDSISPIACTHQGCHDIAELIAYFISTSGEEYDTLAYLCGTHMTEVLDLTALNVPHTRFQ